MNQVGFHSVQIEDLHTKLRKYAKHDQFSYNPLSNKKASYKAKTVQGVEIELKNVPSTKSSEGTCLKIAAAREILSIPPNETKARRLALADAYVLAQANKPSRVKVVCSAGATIFCAFAGTIGISANSTYFIR